MNDPNDLPWLWIVVPTCRPHRIDWIVSRFRDQRYPKKRLLIVENGDAIGATKQLGIVPHALVKSEPHVSHARNAGVDFVRDNGGGWLAMWDDDDYYGPHYLTELAFGIVNKVGDVIGKRRHFVAFGDRLVLFNEINANKPALYLHGPTLCFEASTAKRFPVVSEGEEMRWCELMRAAGRTVRGLSIFHFAYMRSDNPSDHTFKGDARFVSDISAGNDASYELGGVSFDVIDGVVDWRSVVQEVRGERTIPPIAPGSAKPTLRIDGASVTLDLGADWIP